MQSFRALFDTGSQSNFITESAVKSLGFTPAKVDTKVSGLGEAMAPISGDVTCSVGTSTRVYYKLNMHVIKKICGDQPIAQLNTSGWSHIKSLTLADPGFDIPGPIDLLLAADVFVESILNQRIKGGYNQPTAFNSIYGWLLLGKTSLSSTSLLQQSAIPSSDNDLNSIVQRFWEIDSLPSSSSLSPEESLCEQIFISTHSRDKTGRYIVRIPFKNDTEPTFEGSREVALRRFYAIERRLSRDPDLRSQYSEFMSDYLESGHMSLVPSEDMGQDQRDYQRIFWRNSPSEPLKEYRLNTVTYGLASSPYLACRTVRQLAEDEGDSYPLAKQALLTQVYIDDLATGFPTLETAQEAKSQIIALFKRGQFHLRK
ncbi:hypothetical protein HF086_012165 [Spodoptera exigua]|uniref:Peptidase A2 domain-containing protein n=1 Tax=Spodoptera exigua TaxID=7107 RepID=A0A922M6Q7_SPOEX|nr:hypothetical protein HF086_012165 [Spodoptera exigua]